MNAHDQQATQRWMLVMLRAAIAADALGMDIRHGIHVVPLTQEVPLLGLKGGVQAVRVGWRLVTPTESRSFEGPAFQACDSVEAAVRAIATDVGRRVRDAAARLVASTPNPKAQAGEA